MNHLREQHIARKVSQTELECIPLCSLSPSELTKFAKTLNILATGTGTTPQYIIQAVVIFGNDNE